MMGKRRSFLCCATIVVDDCLVVVDAIFLLVRRQQEAIILHTAIVHAIQGGEAARKRQRETNRFLTEGNGEEEAGSTIRRKLQKNGCYHVVTVYLKKVHVNLI